MTDERREVPLLAPSASRQYTHPSSLRGELGEDHLLISAWGALCTGSTARARDGDAGNVVLQVRLGHTAADAVCAVSGLMSCSLTRAGPPLSPAITLMNASRVPCGGSAHRRGDAPRIRQACARPL